MLKTPKASATLSSSTCTSASQYQESDTNTLIQIEKRKVEIMERELEICSKRLKADEQMCEKLDRIYEVLSDKPQSLPSFSEAFSPQKPNQKPATMTNPQENIAVLPLMYNEDDEIINSSGFSYRQLN